MFRNDFNRLVVLEPLSVTFFHFLNSVLFPPLGQHPDDKVQYPQHDYYSQRDNKDIKGGIIANGIEILLVINEPVALFLIILGSELVVAPVALLDVFDEGGDALAEGLCDAAHAGAAAAASTAVATTRFYKGE